MNVIMTSSLHLTYQGLSLTLIMILQDFQGKMQQYYQRPLVLDHVGSMNNINN